jgi:hypothetical protein
MQNTAANLIYRIRVGGNIPPDWSDWFGGMHIQPEENTTLLTGALPDRAALYGILNRLAGLNIDLISLERVMESEKETQD